MAGIAAPEVRAETSRLVQASIPIRPRQRGIDSTMLHDEPFASTMEGSHGTQNPRANCRYSVGRSR